MIKKILGITLSLISAAALFGADLKAKDVTAKAAAQDSIENSIAYLEKTAPTISIAAEKRAVYIFMASLYEQMNQFDDAQRAYAVAAGIAAGDAEGMPKKSNEQLVLDAVRCALSAGDAATADSYLNSAVRNSKNEKVQAHIKLYNQWSELCKANTVEDLQEPVVMLQTYLKLDSMKSVHSTVLLTLWYITGDENYSKQITTNFPASTEAAIVRGDIQLLPTPFWFFVPKSGEVELGTGTFAKETTTASSSATKTTTETKAPATTASTKPAKLQLGLFRTESNANLLKEELVKKGFAPYITKETRASGTTYYIVLVNEDSTNSVAEKLRSAGYECYVVD